MLKRTINFEDYDGNKRSAVYSFHLSKAELVEMEATHNGGMEQLIERISQTNDRQVLVGIFKDMILRSYGIREGDLFVKNDEVRASFTQSPAYSELFIELATNADAAAEFVKGILPTDMAEQIDTSSLTTPLPPPSGGNA